MKLNKRIYMALAVTAILAGCSQQSAPQPDPTPARTGTLLILGDSLTSYIPLIDIRDRVIAEQGWVDVIVDGLSGRSINDVANFESVRGIETYKAHLAFGLKPDAVIVALGVNDMGNHVGEVGSLALYDRRIRQMLDLIGPIPVAWVNIVRWDQGYYLDESRVFNEALARVALDYPNLIIGDWYSMKDVALYWDDDDHLHPNWAGSIARGELYRQLADTLHEQL